MPTNPKITIDGNLSDWTADERIDNPANAVAGYALYGTVQDNTYFIAIQSTAATDPVIGAGTTLWLNTDQNTGTGYSPFGSIGADYNVTFDASGIHTFTPARRARPSSALRRLLIRYRPMARASKLPYRVRRSLQRVDQRQPPSISRLNSTTRPATHPELFIFRVTTATRNTQSRIPRPCWRRRPRTRSPLSIRTPAPISISTRPPIPICSWPRRTRPEWPACRMTSLTSRKLTNINNLIGYDALIFPAMADVNTSQLPAIMSTLKSAVSDYHISIITAGDFLTNDQTGAALPGNSYANMESLLGLARYHGGEQR